MDFRNPNFDIFKMINSNSHYYNFFFIFVNAFFFMYVKVGVKGLINPN